MSPSFIPCLPSAVARAPETPVALRLLPPMQTGGAPRSARIPFEGDILTNTDFCSSTTDCTDPFADRGNLEVVAPDQLSRHTARARTRSRCGRARPDGLLPRTAVRAQAILEETFDVERPDRNERGQKMTNARRITKSARGWFSCRAATAATQ